jgi:DNA gyrase/topoisomerase IV subunit A
VISPEKIDEWINEAEDRPSSSSLIIRFIANRLRELTKWNEELQADNLALRTGQRIEEYEARIEILEYQIGLLKRQLGGEVVLPDYTTPDEATIRFDLDKINLLLYHPQGQVLRMEVPLSEVDVAKKVGHFNNNIIPSDLPLRLLAVLPNEELLFAFDSGRTVTMPVISIPVIERDQLDWQKAFLQPPLGTEELAFIQPVGRMALSEYCIQISRKGCVKKIKEPLFETYLGKSYIGTGIKSPPDKSCALVLCGLFDRLVLASKEGFIQCIDVDPLPTTIEEVIRLNITDHIITAFAVPLDESSENYLLFITENGKVIQRHPEWLNNSNSFKTKGQPVFSQGRREAGIRLAGAALAKKDDWGIAFRSDGQFTFHKVIDLIDTGTLLSVEPEITVLSFTIFRSV